jgi:multicomponent Na+:H+ antiporter subunit E
MRVEASPRRQPRTLSRALIAGKSLAPKGSWGRYPVWIPGTPLLPSNAMLRAPWRRWRSALALAALWAALNRGDLASWAVGLPTVAIAWLLGVLAAPEPLPSLRLLGVLRFLVFFARESALGGLDVARRALHPRRPLAPAIVEHPFRVAPGSRRTLVAGVASLLPGTLSAELAGDRLRLHVLDEAAPNAEVLAALEDCVSGLFAEPRP